MNRRVCLAMRCTGGGLAELQTFCGVMDLTLPVQNTEDYLGCRHNCTKKKYGQSCGSWVCTEWSDWGWYFITLMHPLMAHTWYTVTHPWLALLQLLAVSLRRFWTLVFSARAVSPVATGLPKTPPLKGKCRARRVQLFLTVTAVKTFTKG